MALGSRRAENKAHCPGAQSAECGDKKKVRVSERAAEKRGKGGYLREISRASPSRRSTEAGFYLSRSSRALARIYVHARYSLSLSRRRRVAPLQP